MKMHLLAGAFLLSATSLTFAADSSPSTPSSQKTFHWSGAYAGINLGYGWGESNFVDGEYNGGFAPFPVVHWNADSDGFLPGIQAGHNWQRNNTVFGVEGEIGYLNLKSSELQPGLDPYGDPYDALGTVDGGLYAGLSARLGYALDRTLLYAKAGAIYSQAELGFLDTCTPSPCGPVTTNASEKAGWGYQLGAGVEHAMTEKWTLKAEYAYFDFGNKTITGARIGGGLSGTLYNVSTDLSVHTFKIGVNYKF